MELAVHMHGRTFLASAALGAAVLSRPVLAKDNRAWMLRFVPQSDLTIIDPVFGRRRPCRWRRRAH
jgi:hypothetical protein